MAYRMAYLDALLRILDTRRRIERITYRRRAPVLKAQLDAMRGTYA